MVSLLAGLNAALLRLGALAPVHSVPLADLHGALMIFGFLGTAICLERAVALQSGGARPTTRTSPATRRPRPSVRLLAYVAPLAAGLGGLLALAQVVAPEIAAALSSPTSPDPAPGTTTRLLPGLAWCVAMAALTAIYSVVWFRRQRSVALLVQLLGAVCGLGGIALWTRGLPVAHIVVWWLVFLVLTIIGERLELARISFLSRGTEPRVLTESLVLVLTLPLTLAAPGWGYPLLGLALAALVVDVAWHDVARRTVRLAGLPRLAGACMLTGYAWALVPALVWVVAGPALSGHPYDTVVHALTLGFTMSMILAHAPIIVPAVARREIPYHPVMWVVWGLLEVGLLVRIVAGVRASDGAWRLGGTLGVVALLAFLVTTLSIVMLTSRRARARIDEGDPLARERSRVGDR